MSCKTGHKLNLKQALDIKANQYRNANNRYDYQAEEVEERIYELQSRKDEKEMNKALRLRQKTLAVMDKLNVVDEGELAACDYRFEKDVLIIFKANGFSYEEIDVPPRIMSF